MLFRSPAKAEPAKAESANAEPVKAEPARAAQGKKDEPIVPPASPTDKGPGKTATKLSVSATTIAKLQKLVQEACPGVKDVKIEVTPANKLRIELTVRSDDQIGTFAGNIYGVSELADYRDEIELYFTVAEQAK